MSGIVEKITLVNDSGAAFKELESGLSSLGASVGQVTSSLGQMGASTSILGVGADSIARSASNMSMLGDVTDKAKNSLNRLIVGPKSFKRAVDRINLNKELGIPLSGAERRTLRLASAASKMGSAFGKAGNAAKKISGVMSSTKGFGMESIAKAGAAIYTGKAILGAGKGLMSKADAYTVQSAQLGGMNLGDKSKEQYKTDVYESAQATGLDYVDFADMVRTLGDTVGDSFKDATQIKEFAETMSKAFYVSGNDAEDQVASMQNIIIGMGMGQIEGRKLNQVLSKAPSLAKHLGDELGVPKEKLIEMARAGEVTTDSLIAAVARAGTSINEEFEKMPVTWSQTTARLGNTFNEAMMPVYGTIASFADSPEMASFGEGLISMIGPAVEGILSIGQALGPSFSTLLGAVGGLGDGVVGLIKSASPLIERVVGFVSDVIGSALSMGDTFAEPWESVLGLADNIMDIIEGLFGSFQDFGPSLSEPFAAVVDILGDAIGWVDKLVIKSGLLGGAFKIIGFVLKGVKPVLNVISTLLGGIVRIISKGIDLLGEFGSWAGESIASMVYGSSDYEKADGTQRVIVDNTVELAKAYAKAKEEHEKGLWGRTELENAEFLLEELLWEEQKLNGLFEKSGSLPGMDMLFGNLQAEILKLYDSAEALRADQKSSNKDAKRRRSKSQTVKIDKESIDLLDALARLQFVNRYTSMQPNFTQNIIMKSGSPSEFADGASIQSKAFMKSVANNATALGSI